jgi:hypothetical protein
LNRVVNRLGTHVERCRRVNTRHILRDHDARIDVQHLINHFVLTKIDIDARDGQHERLEDGPGGCVVPSQKSLAALTKMSAHVVRIGRADASRRLSELSGLVDDPSRWRAWLPSSVASCGARNKRICEGGSLVILNAIQHSAHERAQLRSCHRFESAIEIRIVHLTV